MKMPSRNDHETSFRVRGSSSTKEGTLEGERTREKEKEKKM